MKQIIDYITEKANFLVKKHLPHKSGYDYDDVDFNFDFADIENKTINVLNTYKQAIDKINKSLELVEKMSNNRALILGHEQLSLSFTDYFMHILFIYDVTGHDSYDVKLILSDVPDYPDDSDWDECKVSNEISFSYLIKDQVDKLLSFFIIYQKQLQKNILI